jgi:DNA-binding response OmpR family regulator
MIDDDPDVTITLQAALEQYGFTTDSYNDPVIA